MRATLLALSISYAAAAHGEVVPAPFTKGMQALMRGDYAEAYCLWKPLAESGYAEAQYHLGWLYANGNGLAVDITHALALWGAAADQGHADAQFAVALAYTTGDGLKKDLNEAVAWYLRAARQGHQDARDILLRLNGDRSVNLLDEHPEVVEENWFGWTGEVSGERINVRGGPGTNHKIVATLTRGTLVRVVGRRGDWFMVVLPDDDGNMTHNRTAWIYRTLLSSASG
ncbi:MAG: SEL1-like repeat protein [Gammaproteobacteria bacterium]|nr:SEL1-like repeat protein [Gammaproteobacteria bacterium]